MADFSALIAQIEAYVKQNGNNDITGNGLQSILVGMVNALGTVAITALQGDLADEVTARTNADGAINAKIPAEASSSNKLADKAFVTGLTTALQNAVNAINANIENGYVYAGIATPSGTPVSGKVFYLARQAGTYTNFGGLTLTEGVNVLKYNGTAWSQEQLISIADIYKNPLIGYYECDTAGGTAAKTVAATGYVLPTTGGSVKIKMANRNTVANATLNINSTGAKPLFYNGVRAGVGNTWDTNEIVEVFYDGTNYQAYNVAGSNGDGVFDISAYNLTDGQPTPYIDLAAALGTDGEHVPQSLRKGGMSVKFIQGTVQSSDNMYVQYRLMSNSFNTTVANWQGVDLQPTHGSKNFVESGGVATLISTSDAREGKNNYINTASASVGTSFQAITRAFSGLSSFVLNLFKKDVLTIDYTGVEILEAVTKLVICDKDFFVTNVITLNSTTTTFEATDDCIAIFNLKGSANAIIRSTLVRDREMYVALSGVTKMANPFNLINKRIKLSSGSYLVLPHDNGKKFVLYIASTNSSPINLMMNYSDGSSYHILGRITSLESSLAVTMPTDAEAVYLNNNSGAEFDGYIYLVYEEDSYTNKVYIPELLEKENLVAKTLTHHAGYINFKGNSNDLSGNPDTTWNYTDYVEVEEYSRYRFIGNISADSIAYIALYSEDHECLRVIGSSQSSPLLETDIFINEGEKYIRLSSYVTLSQLYQVFIENGQEKRLEGALHRIDFLEKNYALNPRGKSFSGIYKFGVVGDSLSVGHMDNPDPQLTRPRNILYSWPQVLARKTGQVALNFGSSGVTAKTWWTTDKCKNELIKEDNYCQSYIIGLGVNDQGSTIGTMSDVDWSDYNNNADTFIGNYVKILQLIHEIKPDAVMFVLTPTYPYMQFSFADVIQALETICNDTHIQSWGNVFFVDLRKYESYMRYVSKHQQDYHYSSCGYALIADMIQYAVSEVIDEFANENANLRTMGFIEYGDNLTPIE